MAIIKGRPTRKRIVTLVTISRYADKRLVIILFAIRKFFSAAVIFLAFFMTFSVFGGGSFFVFFPVIAIMNVRVSFMGAGFKRWGEVSHRLVRIIRRHGNSVIGRVGGVGMKEVIE